MRTKFLFGACALSALFVGCNNEEFLENADAPKAPMAMEEVVGADLVSSGMSVIIDGGAQTKVNGGGWETSDAIGMGWYDITGKGIYGSQAKTTWDKLDPNKTISLKDNKIYANDKFFVEGNKFKTNANIYQGAHYVYFPYTYQGQVATRTFEVNSAVQTDDFEKDMLNNALHISAQDFIATTDVEGSEGVLEKRFILAPVVNVIKVIATPQNEIKDNATMSEYAVRKMVIAANGAFKTSTGEIKPYYLPKVVRKTNGDIDDDETYEAMALGDNLNKVMTNNKFVNTLTTTVNGSNLNLSNVNELRAFTLPTNEGYKSGSPTAEIYVGRQSNGKDYDLGYFKIDGENGEMAKLNEALTTGVGGNSELTLKNILTAKNSVTGGWELRKLAINASLLAKNFTAQTTGIQSIDQWNDLADLYDALVEILGDNNVEVPTFTLGTDLTFENVIKTPKNIDIKFGTNGNTLKIKGIVSWPDNLSAASDNENVEVLNGQTLNLNCTLDAKIVNNGTINAGALASVSTQEHKKLDNTNGRIIVEYGAYVYAGENQQGIVAYKVKDARPATIGMVNTLVTKTDSDGSQKEFANVNTLMVYTTLNLNAEASKSNGDRYEPTADSNLTALDDVDIELMGNGHVVYTGKINNSDNKTVKNVTAVAGKNSIKDIELAKGAKMTVNAGSVLNVESAGNTDAAKTALIIDGDIVNEGTLNANTKIVCNNIDNAKGIVNANKNKEYGVWYENEYLQGGIVNGQVNQTVKDPVETKKDAAKAVVDLVQPFYDTFSNNIGNKYENFVKNINTYATGNSIDGQDKILAAINHWLEICGKEAIKNGSLTVDMIKLIEHDAEAGTGFVD